MGYHADVYTGLAELLAGGLPAKFPVLNVLTASEAELSNFSKGVCIVRESIDYEPHPSINPDVDTADQGEMWAWTLYITGGGGRARPAGSGAEVDRYLEQIRTALNAQRPTTDCGPMHLASEEFEGREGATVTYTQRWIHRRLAG